MMNERIRELWRDCVLKHTKDPMNWQTVADEFARLIVEECIEIVEYKGRKIGTKHPVGFNLMDAAWDIKEHFGVEERKGWVCPKCGTDRIKAVCPLGHTAAITGDCPMIATAHGVEE